MSRLLAGRRDAGRLTGVAPTAAAGEPGATPFVQVRIDQVTPQVVTTTSEPLVTVTGTVTNIGDRPVRDVMVRLEHAAAVTTSAGLRTNLDGDTDQYEAVADFADGLPRAAARPEGRRSRCPPRCARRPSIRWISTRPASTRCWSTSTARPITANRRGWTMPGSCCRCWACRRIRSTPSGDRGALGAVVAPDTSKPVPVTMLWPLADRPRLAPGVPGGTIPVRLMDDELATSLAGGGRLDVLLSAAEFATSRDVDPDGAVGRSLCLAVDPDLLVTVNAMTAGYVVSELPRRPRAAAGHPDAPGGRAGRRGQLVEPAAHTGAPDVRRAAALRAGRPRRRATDRRPRAQRDRHQRGRRRRRPDPRRRRGPRRHPDPRRLADPPRCGPAERQRQHRRDRRRRLLRRRLQYARCRRPRTPRRGGCRRRWCWRRSTPPSAPRSPRAGSDPVAPTYLNSALAIRLQHDSEIARRQDALGSMLWRALQPRAMPRAQILLPPTNWKLRPDDAGAILTTLATAIRSGLAVPRPLPALIADASAVPPVNGTAQPDVDAGATRPVQRRRHRQDLRRGGPAVRA